MVQEFCDDPSSNSGRLIRLEHALVIEDEFLIAMELETLLLQQGFKTVDIAVSRDEALSSALRQRPDLITADYRIVDGTGVEAVAAVEARLGPLAVLYVSGNCDLVAEDDRARVRLEKPFNAVTLANACQQAIQQHLNRRTDGG